MTKIISCECEEGANDNYENKILMQGSPSSLVQPDTVSRKNGKKWQNYSEQRQKYQKIAKFW